MPDLTALQLANAASFQAFVNCYLREVDSGLWSTAADWQRASCVVLGRGEHHVVELRIDARDELIAIGVSYRSLAGRHTLTEVYRRSLYGGPWRRIDTVTALLSLVDAIYALHPDSEQRLELIARLMDSHQVMAKYLRRHLETPCPARAPASFIASEQSTLLGHWLHPTPKSRQGIHAWQHPHYVPELGARFQLHFFAAARDLVRQDSLLEVPAEELTRRLASSGPSGAGQRRAEAAVQAGYCLLPLHPLQAQWLLHQDHVRALRADARLVDLGPLGPAFTPTSSVRTLYSEDVDFMIKLSIPVKLTNSLRINLHSELGDSVWVSKLLRACGTASRFPLFRFIEDPAYITVVLPQRDGSSADTGFEVIFRSNPFGAPRAKDEVHSIAALVQEPLDGQGPSLLAQLVRRLAAAEGCPLEEASRAWFESYFTCAIESALRLYDAHGLGLEAHQQNVLLDFTPTGRPLRCYYRDIQGVGLAEGARDQLAALVPELALQPRLFEPDAIVRDNVGYYLFCNQLCAVINRLGLDGLSSEAALLELVRGRLLGLRAELRGFGAALIEVLLEQPTIPCKANLLTRAADLDELEAENELAVYRGITNPLHALATEPTLREGTEGLDAPASEPLSGDNENHVHQVGLGVWTGARSKAEGPSRHERDARGGARR